MILCTGTRCLVPHHFLIDFLLEYLVRGTGNSIGLCTYTPVYKKCDNRYLCLLYLVPVLEPMVYRYLILKLKCSAFVYCPTFN